MREGRGEIDRWEEVMHFGEAVAFAAKKILSDHSHCKTKPVCCGSGGEVMYIYLLLRVCVYVSHVSVGLMYCILSCSEL